MSVSTEQFEEWKALVLSPSLLDVLNAMEDIAQSGDPEGASLLKMAGKNAASLALERTITGPSGRVTFGEYQEQKLAQLLGTPAGSGLTKAEQEVEQRVEQFMKYAVRAQANFLVDDSANLVRQLAEARNKDVQASPQEIYRKVKGWKSIRRAEDGDPTGAYGGQFAYLTQQVDDPECRAAFSRVDRGRRVELSNDLYDMKRIRSYWMSEVRPQQFAFYDLELLDRFTQVPTDGWSVGPV